jgi:hypothetical protein
MSVATEDELPSYHDLHITTATIPRTSIFNLGYGLEVTCTRARGWALWNHWSGKDELLAGEYEEEENWLVLDVGGHVIVDSRRREFVGAESVPVGELPGGWNGVVTAG